jgi:hypothetical protein
MHARQTKSPTYSQDWIERVLAAEIVAPLAELVDTPLVKLIKSAAFEFTPQTLLAAFTAAQADFTDYASKALTLTGPRAVGPLARANGGVVSWLMTTDPVVTGNRIYGYYVEDANGWVLAELFSAEDQIDMTEVGAALILETLLPLPYNVPLA